MCLSAIPVMLCACGSGDIASAGSTAETTATVIDRSMTSAAITEITEESTVSTATAVITERATDMTKKHETTDVSTTSSAVPASAPSKTKLAVEYIRTFGELEEAKNASAEIIDSTTELKSYCKGEAELDAVAQKYGDNYFKTGVLIAVPLIENSGSIRHEVKGVTESEEGLTVEINALSSGVSTMDMAIWHIIIEYPRGDYETVSVNRSYVKY